MATLDEVDFDLAPVVSLVGRGSPNRGFKDDNVADLRIRISVDSLVGDDEIVDQ